MSAWTIPADAIRRQTQAADPASSAWVSAHAGSGKTHVLAQRVVRLLLEGAPPSRILCLTFTKAAAANMALRVFGTLADWTRLDDEALAAAIARTGAHPGASAAELDAARRLFARAVETPGGLKIQTIHAFCEKLLHLFPFEANVPARFDVLTEEKQDELIARAREEIIGRAMAGEDRIAAAALAQVAAITTSFSFDSLLRQALARRRAVQAAGRRQPGETLARLRDVLGAPMDQSAAQLRAQIAGEDAPLEAWRGLAERLALGGAADLKCAALVRQAIEAPAAVRAEAWMRVFFTSEGAPRKKLVTKALDGDPGLGDVLRDEQERLVGLRAATAAAEAAERSDALATFAERIIERYTTMKRARGFLDFDDLIERANALVSRSDAALWVLFKLDAGIDHILVDEAQDTSQTQWSILEALTSDFFAGAGARRATRTFFAVGDEKQSIFSFQGADARLFAQKRRAFERVAREADRPFAPVQLKLSFRSARPILDEVDRVFSHADHAMGVIDPTDAWMPHEALKATMPGLVEVWPPVGQTAQAEPSDWRMPLDRLDESAPPVALARRIAALVASWLAPGSLEAVHDKAGALRPVRADDILILVRKRGPFFDAVIRALKEADVPVAGADRLELTEHIAVLDLMAAGRAALLARDDLNLACVLKSPLIGLGEDDLMELAPGRRGSLWDALRASPEPRHQRAAERIAGWRRRAGDSPFLFYARLLGAEGGRAALLARLGPEAADAADEFLKQALESETTQTPSLVGFLHAMEISQRSIKRDMETAGETVRVMTVHASKGLEAPIVFLPDTCSAPVAGHDPEILTIGDDDDPLLAWRRSVKSDPEPIAQALARERQAATDEHRRLLYVAMTRAEERLYVCGFHGKRGPADGCWHAMISAALADAATEAPAPWDSEARVMRIGAQARLAAPSAPAQAGGAPEALPGWLLADAPRERSPEPPVAPSTALSAADQADAAGSPDYGADPLAQDGDGLRLGALTHTLLQRLPDVAPEGRRALAERFLAARARDFDEARRSAIAARALAVIDDPALAALFGPDSRAEVSISARIPVGESEVPIVGQIDRIAVLPDEIIVADFKSGAPRAAEAVPPAYVGQLALYAAAAALLWPGRRVRALLVWTAGPLAVEPAPARLEAALAEIAARHGQARGGA